MPRQFGPNGAIRPLKTPSSPYEDYKKFIGSLVGQIDGEIQDLVYQNSDFAIVTTKHAVVCVRRRPMMSLEWSAAANTILSIPRASRRENDAEDAEDAEDAKDGQADDAAKCLKITVLSPVPIPHLSSIVSLSKPDSGFRVWGSTDFATGLFTPQKMKHTLFQSKSITVESTAELDQLCRRLHKWWQVARLPGLGSTLGWAAPGVYLRSMAFSESATRSTSATLLPPPRVLRRSAKKSQLRVAFHDIASNGSKSVIKY